VFFLLLLLSVLHLLFYKEGRKEGESELKEGESELKEKRERERELPCSWRAIIFHPFSTINSGLKELTRRKQHRVKGMLVSSRDLGWKEGKKEGR
jgi:hypothetical protein